MIAKATSYAASLVVFLGSPLSCSAQNAQVEVTSLGPVSYNSESVSLSADLSHVAVTGNQGSRMAAFLDGKPGSLYDQVLTVPPVLSADGKHLAYAASRDQNSFIVVDGKEYGPYDQMQRRHFYTGPPVDPYTGVVALEQYNSTPEQALVFSPDGLHFAFVVKKGGQDVVVEDGREIATGRVYGKGVSFSSHGDHLAFAVQDARQSATTVYLDSLAGPAFTSMKQMQFSDDGHHFLYVGETGPLMYSAYLDGKPGPGFQVIDQLSLSRDGTHLAYHAATKQTGSVVIDGRVISSASRVWMTPDGKHTAYVQETGERPGMGARLVWDGHTGQQYRSIQDLRFAPDGHPIYVALAQNSRTFLIDGERESEPFSSVDLTTLTFSLDKRHVAFVAKGEGGQAVVLDGKKLAVFPQILLAGRSEQVPAIQFIPDGHVVYYASTQRSPRTLVRDGEVLGDAGAVSPDGNHVATIKLDAQGSSEAKAQMTFDGKAGPAFMSITQFAFSSDSKHFAYVGQASSATGAHYVLVIDNASKPLEAEVNRLQYSPDSKHLFFSTITHVGNAEGVAYMDGEKMFTGRWLGGGIATWTDQGHALTIITEEKQNQLIMIRYGGADAPRQKSVALIESTGAVNLAESRRILGDSPAASAQVSQNGSGGSGRGGLASSPSSTATGGTGVYSGAASAMPETGGSIGVRAVDVELLDLLNSDSPSAGMQYRAQLLKPLQSSSGGQLAPAGAPATVALLHEGSEWTIHLVSVTSDGRAMAVTSGAAQMGSSSESNRSKTARQTLGRFGGLGRSLGSLATVQEKVSPTSGSHIALPSGTHLSFMLQ